MAVPRNRHSTARRNSKRAHHAKPKLHLVACHHCGKQKLPHRLCSSCGVYQTYQSGVKE